MIELAFGESPAGALKLAKSGKPGERMAASVGVIGGTKQERRKVKAPRFWQGAAMEGSARDVAALTLALDIGDISACLGPGLSGRKKTLDALFSGFPGVSNSIWKTNQAALKRLLEADSAREPVRMWVCASNPAELCAMYFTCHLLAGAAAPLSVVRIPEQIKKEDLIMSFRGTGEIPPQEFGALARYEQPVDAPLRRLCASIWKDLVLENAPLRAVVNGALLGVPETFYDFALRANIPDGACTVARILGNTLNQAPGVGDRWLFLRIQAMLRSGELIEVSPPTGDHPYSGVVKRIIPPS